MASLDSYYEVLGIARDASQAEIEQAYQSLMQRLKQKIAAGEKPDAELFDTLSTAFATLRNPEERQAYNTSQGIPNRIEPVAQPTSADTTPPTLTATRLVADDTPHDLHFAFVGSGSEYFRIWIVNLLLSIVTLGIYSAWAKVRREQYFHRNTLLDRAGFDYHATPKAILIGRIIALGFFALFSAAKGWGPLPYVLFLILAAGAAPWLLVRAYRFRARNTSYRGLRFSFSGNYEGVAIAFVGYAVLALITVGLLTPLWIRQMRLYLLNHLHYGHGDFYCDAPTKPFFIIVAKPILIALATGIVIGILGWAISPIFLVLLGILSPIAYLTFFPYVQMSLNNLVWNHAAVEGNTFHSEMRFGSYFGLVFRNWLFILLTLGLYWPWARVNLASYRAEHTGLVVHNGLDHFIAAATEHVSALGDETAEMFDIEIAL